jgi:hypothetical protein
MDYLIYEDGELLEVLTFLSQDEITKYKKANPSHVLELIDDLEDDFLLGTEDFPEDDDFDV